MNSILDTYAPLKKNKYKLKFKTKPWITPALQKFLLKTNFITAKDHQIKERYYKEPNIKTTETCYLQF